MIDKLSEMNFNYDLDVKYTESHSCDQSGCDDEGICRCGVITDTYLVNIQLNKVSKRIFELYFDGSDLDIRDSKISKVLYGFGRELDEYIIDRIVRRTLNDTDNWVINIDSGYYGQEIESVNIIKPIIDSLDNTIRRCLSIDDPNDRIRFLLNFEYGKLYDGLDTANFYIKEINIDDIIFTSESHKKLVENKSNKYYSDKLYSGIRGVFKSVGNGKYKIVDGHHRVNETSKKSILSIIY